MRIVDAYSISPQGIRPGDVMLYIVKALVVREGVYRLYRCPATRDILLGEIPQGSRISNEEEVCEALFPTLAAVAQPDTQ